MLGGNPSGRHLPHQAQKHVDHVCPECKGAKYVGPILGINPCPRGCANSKAEDAVWTEQERLSRNERGGGK